MDEKKAIGHIKPPETIPTQVVIEADAIGKEFAGLLAPLVDASLNDVLRKAGPNGLKVTQFGLLIGLERMKATLLHVIEVDGGPLESIVRALALLHASERERMKAIDASKIVRLG